MSTDGSPIDSGYLLQSLGAYGDSTPAPVQAKIVDQAAINTNKRIGQLALFYDNGDPFTITADVASLPLGAPPTPASDHVVAIQGGAAVLLTIQSLMAKASSLTISTSGGPTDGEVLVGVSGLTKGAISLFQNSDDTVPRLMASASLGILFGPGGSSSLDTTLARSDVGALQLTGSLLSTGATNGLTVTGSAASHGSFAVSGSVYGMIMAIKSNSGDANAATLITPRSFQMGLGGANAIDWSLNHVSAARADLTGHLGFVNAYNLIFGTTTGTKIGTGTTQKIGFWNATPIVRPTGWASPYNGTAYRTAYDVSTVTTTQLAERVKALIDDLMTMGLIGA